MLFRTATMGRSDDRCSRVSNLIRSTHTQLLYVLLYHDLSYVFIFAFDLAVDLGLLLHPLLGCLTVMWFFCGNGHCKLGRRRGRCRALS